VLEHFGRGSLRPFGHVVFVAVHFFFGQPARVPGLGPEVGVGVQVFYGLLLLPSNSYFRGTLRIKSLLPLCKYGLVLLLLLLF